MYFVWAVFSHFRAKKSVVPKSISRTSKKKRGRAPLGDAIVRVDLLVEVLQGVPDPAGQRQHVLGHGGEVDLRCEGRVGGRAPGPGGGGGGLSGSS